MSITEITYARGATINTGNFNSARVDLSATMQLSATDGDPDGAYARLKRWVDEKVAADVLKHGGKVNG